MGDRVHLEGASLGRRSVPGENASVAEDKDGKWGCKNPGSATLPCWVKTRSSPRHNPSHRRLLGILGCSALQPSTQGRRQSQSQDGADLEPQPHDTLPNEAVVPRPSARAVRAPCKAGERLESLWDKNIAASDGPNRPSRGGRTRPLLTSPTRKRRAPSFGNQGLTIRRHVSA